MDRSELVFAYGSNMDPAQMRRRCPESDLSSFVAEARGWRLCFPRWSDCRKGGVASVVADKTNSVWGVVFSVSAVDLNRLNGCEGVPTSYKRDHVMVTDQHGRNHTAWAYFANPQGDPPREYDPHEDYINHFVKGAEHFGLPQPYVKFLRDLKAKAHR